MQGPRRTHPITPLTGAWKTLAVVVGMVSIQNLPHLMREFSVPRLLLALGIIAAVVVLTVVIGAVSWWRTTYEITAEGVTLRTGLLTLTRRSAPREKIDSVSVERPLVARLLGLAKVRIEISGGGESHLEIALVQKDEAEQIRRQVLALAPGAASRGAMLADGAETGLPGAQPRLAAPTADLDADPADASPVVGHRIACIPTARLLQSMIRDLGNAIAVVIALIAAAAIIVGAVLTDGVSVAALIAVLPALIAGPKHVLGVIERGWGFTSWDTDRGLRMQRGLLNTRTDSISAGRIQKLELSRPLLWRGPGWTAVEAAVAAIEAELGEDAATHVLPVGTAEELRETVDRLLPPLGTDDDHATLEQLLRARARDIDGLRPADRLIAWIGHRTRAVVLLPQAVVLRRGVLSHSLDVIPRDRIQQVRLSQGPITRRAGVLELRIDVAGAEVTIEDLPHEDALALARTLARDAATHRRYRDRESWRVPAASTRTQEAP